MDDYYLLKKLKDAGFPQHDKEVGAEYLFRKDIKNPNDRVYIPSLSELIKECGDDFDGLVPLRDVITKRENKITGWSADPGDTFNNEADGKTPEIAVTKLYILLNE